MNKFDAVAMADNHGDLACEDTLNQIISFTKRVKPTYRIHMGDNWDFRWARRGIDKSSAEAKEGLEDDLNSGIKWIEQYRPTHFLMGNHDDRIRQILHSTDSIKDREDMQKIQDLMMRTLRKVGCKVIKPYTVKEGRIVIGPLTWIHGFSHGQNALLKDARTFGSPGGGFTMGHLHRLEQLNNESFDGGASWLCGCAMDINRAEYAMRHSSTLRWQNGFMYYKCDGANYIGKQAHRFGKGWYLPA